MFAFLLSALKTQSLQQTVCILSLIVQVVLTFLVVRFENSCSTALRAEM